MLSLIVPMLQKSFFFLMKKKKLYYVKTFVEKCYFNCLDLVGFVFESVIKDFYDTYFCSFIDNHCLSIACCKLSKNFK